MKNIIKSIIVDDEPMLIEVLVEKLSRHCPNVMVLGTANNASQSFELINEIKPDLVFLDIAMPEESGFDLINKFENIEFEIIFVTGFNEYAIDALKVSAVDYLLKPVKPENLTSAVKKVQERLLAKIELENLRVLKYNLQNLGKQNTKIGISNSDSYEFISIEDIIRIEGWQKYCKIFIKGGKEILSSNNIGYYRKILGEYDFHDCHKSHMVNKNHIVKFLKEGSVVMSDNSNVPVSRRKKDEFLNNVIKKLS